MSERIKFTSYNSIYLSRYFWRTYDQQEIDLVEETGGKLSAFEFKWSNKTSKIPGAWKKAYPEANFTVINQNNYLEFIT
jgi:hypothetical protein